MDAQTEKFMALAAEFASAELRTYRCSAPPEEGLKARWKPMLGNKIVRLATTPEHGYLTQAEAIDAARTYKENCRIIVARQTGK
jgi:hypothetical protein